MLFLPLEAYCMGRIATPPPKSQNTPQSLASKVAEVYTNPAHEELLTELFMNTEKRKTRNGRND